MTLPAAHPFRNRPTVGIRDLDRAAPRQGIPLDALRPLLDAWNAAQEKAKAAYYGSNYRPRADWYAAQTAKSETQQRYRARKKEQQA